MWLLTSFWRTLVAGTVLLGLLYIPSDIKGLPRALRTPLGFVVTYKETSDPTLRGGSDPLDSVA